MDGVLEVYEERINRSRMFHLPQIFSRDLVAPIKRNFKRKTMEIYKKDLPFHEIGTSRLGDPHRRHFIRVAAVQLCFLGEAGTGRVVPLLVQSLAGDVVRAVPASIGGALVTIAGAGRALHVAGATRSVHITGTVAVDGRVGAHPLLRHGLHVVVLGELVRLLVEGAGVLPVTERDESNYNFEGIVGENFF